MSTKPAVTKKVRLACRRCRTRRIKCDGQIPACSNCAKAGEVCIDVDSQNADVLIPRNFANAAKARIQWLENIIRDKLPGVDLSLGPSVGLPSEPAFSQGAISAEDNGSDVLAENIVPHSTGSLSASGQTQSRKRTAEEDDMAETEESFPEGARSVAFNLGMLSLNSDSSQRHYLGSSSGLLFTNIIGASPSSDTSGSAAHRNSVAPIPDHHQTLAGQKASHQRYATLHQLLRQELPPREDALHLLRTFLLEIHPDYPVLEPFSLESALEALYDCSTCSLENDALLNGWPRSVRSFYWNGVHIQPSYPSNADIHLPVVAFTFFMIFNVAAIAKVRMRVYEYSPEKFYRAALLFSGDCFARTSLSSIQALVLLIVHSFLTPAEVNLWTLIHIAMAHCIELGIHREPSHATEEDATYVRIKRFTFYVIYSLDRTISTIQGRPLSIRDETFDVQMPNTDFVTEPLNGGDTSISSSFQADVTKYATYQFKLDRIVSDIKTNLYLLPVQSTQFAWPKDPTNHQDRINTTLQSWWEDTSKEMSGFQGIDTFHQQLWSLKMKIKYHTTMILLFQPSQVIRQPSDDALNKCFSSACAILQSYQLLQDWHSLQYGWRAVQNIFAAGATIIYTFWCSKAVQRSASVTELSKALRSCSSLLSVGGEWWPSVRRGKSSFETVVDLTIRKLYTSGSSSKQPRLDIQHQRNTNPNRLNNSVSTSVLQSNADIDSFADQDLSFGILNQQIFQAHDPRLMPAQSNLSNAEPSAFQAVPDGFTSYSNASPEAHSSIGILPEIEDFLADFDNSDFSWNMPLHSFEDHGDFGNFFFNG